VLVGLSSIKKRAKGSSSRSESSFVLLVVEAKGTSSLKYFAVDRVKTLSSKSKNNNETIEKKRLAFKLSTRD
jgi:hypothetical protein